MTVSTGVIQVPQALKTPVMQEFVACMASYNTGLNRTLRRVNRIGIDGNKPYPSSSVISSVVSCPSPTPPSGLIWNGSIVNIQGNTATNSMDSSELNAPI